MNKRTILIVAGAIAVVALLAGGAFMGMRQLNVRTQFGGGGPGLSMVTGGGGKGAVSVMIKQVPAPELPKQATDLRGMVTSVKDNSIYVSPMDKIQVAVINGVQQQMSTPTGPSTEVVVGKDTKIWRDVTMESMPKPPTGAGNSGSPVQVQQKVEPAEISAITPNSFVQVWGQRRGDRLNADTIVVMGIGVAKGK